MTGLALIGVALACLVVGGRYWWSLVMLASLLMLAEWASMTRAPRGATGLAFAGLLVSLLLASPWADLPEFAAPVAMAIAASIVLAATRLPRLALGLLYAGVPALALIYLHDQFDGTDLTIWTMAIVWATDIGAYFSGRRFGGPKLAPVLSPNKTWSGLIGGIASAVVVSLALSRVLHVELRLAACAGLLAIAAQAGDIYESAMKRRAGVKDSGRILPGHGGVMDRLDGVVPVASLVALLVAGGLI